MNEPTIENVHFRTKKKPKHQLRYIEDQTCSLRVEQVSKLPFAHKNTKGAFGWVAKVQPDLANAG